MDLSKHKFSVVHCNGDDGATTADAVDGDLYMLLKDCNIVFIVVKKIAFFNLFK